MPNNSPEQIRQKLYEAYEDSLFKLVMHDAAEQEGQLFLEEKEKLKNDPEFLPSHWAFQKFRQQLDNQLKKSKAYALRRRMGQALSKAAMVMLIVMVILGAAAVTVQAVRVRVLNFMMDIQQEYTSFELKDSSSSEGNHTIVGWRQAYVPTYMPDGYEIYAAKKNELSSIIEFRNPQGASINYIELSQSSKTALDTENAAVFETVSINGHEGTVVGKNDLITVIWAMDDRMFIIQGKINKDTALKIAGGVKYID